MLSQPEAIATALIFLALPNYFPLVMYSIDRFETHSKVTYHLVN